MTPILTMVYSEPFFIGAVVGLTLQRIYNHQKCRYMERHHPLPGGAHYNVAHISRVWIAGLAAVLSIGYVLMTAQRTQDQTINLTKDVARCWAEAYQSTKAQIKLNADNDLISRAQQDLQRQFDIATSDWLKQLVAPPGDLANADINSEARKQWGLQVTAAYQARLDDLGAQFDEQVARRNALDQARSQHPLPPVTCGKG